MAQTKTTIPSKNTNDELSAVEFNSLVDVVNNNAADIDSTLNAVEGPLTVINDSVVAQGASSPIPIYASHDLPDTADTGSIAYNRSTEELIYFKNGKWNNFKDNAEIVFLSSFVFTIDTRNTEIPDPAYYFPSNSNQFTLPFVEGGSYDCTIDWDCNNPGQDTQTFNTISGTDVAGPITHTYSAEGEYLISISGIVTGFQFREWIQTNHSLASGDSLKIINIEDFGQIAYTGATNSRTACNRAFINCSNLTITAPSIPNTETSADFLNMFYKCHSLTQVPYMDVSGGTRFWGMFRDCTSLESLPNYAFNNSQSLHNKFTEIFQNCSSLTTLENIDFGNMQGSCYSSFRGCSSLTSIPSSCDFNTVTDFAFLMRDCSLITTFPQFGQIGNGVNFTDAWQGCALTAEAIADILQALVDTGKLQSEIYYGQTKASTLGHASAGTSFSGGTNAAKSTWSAAALLNYDILTASIGAAVDGTALTGRGWVIPTN